jgi:hypothetical protein
VLNLALISRIELEMNLTQYLLLSFVHLHLVDSKLIPELQIDYLWDLVVINFELILKIIEKNFVGQRKSDGRMAAKDGCRVQIERFFGFAGEKWL